MYVISERSRPYTVSKHSEGGLNVLLGPFIKTLLLTWSVHQDIASQKEDAISAIFRENGKSRRWL